MNSQYPIYIPSKGRAENHQTPSALDGMKVPYRIVVEPQEYDAYASTVKRENILVLPFSNLGMGSVPARNWIWEHSIALGAKRHWCLDDNIDGFVRLNRNTYYPCASGTLFKIHEEFVERYENVALSGLHYRWLAKRKQKLPPFYVNRRIYSCLLIKNDIPYRWRGRYNEDTDLSLRVLKDGWCTILFLAFLANKTTTLTMKGGNEEIYKGDGRFQMAQSLCEQHPDVARVSWKWGRWQHQVDYSRFKRNKLKLKPDAKFEDGVCDYGMVLKEVMA